jgi:hypothetical protein
MADATPSSKADFPRLSEGLTYTSETDAPVEAVHWPKGEAEGALTKEDVLRLAGLPKESRVTTQSVRAFFEPVAQEADWQNEEEHKVARRFQELSKAVEGLKGAKAYTIGENPMDVYIVGQTGDGDVLGVKTRVVET